MKWRIFQIFPKSLISYCKSQNSGEIKKNLRDLRLPGIQVMTDVPNIIKILDFLLADLGNPDTSLITGGFPQAKPFENRNFSAEKHSPRNLNFSGKCFSGKSFSGETFLGGRVSVESEFPEICPDSGISRIVEAPGYPGNGGLSKYSQNP